MFFSSDNTVNQTTVFLQGRIWASEWSDPDSIKSGGLDLIDKSVIPDILLGLVAEVVGVGVPLLLQLGKYMFWRFAGEVVWSFKDK